MFKVYMMLPDLRQAARLRGWTDWQILGWRREFGLGDDTHMPCFYGDARTKGADIEITEAEARALSDRSVRTCWEIPFDLLAPGDIAMQPNTGLVETNSDMGKERALELIAEIKERDEAAVAEAERVMLEQQKAELNRLQSENRELRKQLEAAEAAMAGREE